VGLKYHLVVQTGVMQSLLSNYFSKIVAKLIILLSSQICLELVAESVISYWVTVHSSNDGLSRESDAILQIDSS